jgi:hypothetical protein
MPPRVDAGLFLAFDTDPIEGRLAALGCLFEQEGWSSPRKVDSV